MLNVVFIIISCEKKLIGYELHGSIITAITKYYIIGLDFRLSY